MISDRTAPGSGFAKNDQEAAQIAASIMSDLMSGPLGLTREQAIGVVANLAHETGNFKHSQEISPTVRGSKGGLGWAQWTGFTKNNPRRGNFESWSKQKGLPTTSYAANLGFLTHELQTVENRALQSLKSAKTARDATIAFERDFERAGVPHHGSRLQYAERLAALDVNPPAFGPLPAIDVLQAPALGFAAPMFAPANRPGPTPFSGGKRATGVAGIPSAAPRSMPSIDGARTTGQIAVPSTSPRAVTIAPGYSQSLNVDQLAKEQAAERAAARNSRSSVAAARARAVASPAARAVSRVSAPSVSPSVSRAVASAARAAATAGPQTVSRAQTVGPPGYGGGVSPSSGARAATVGPAAYAGTPAPSQANPNGFKGNVSRGWATSPTVTANPFTPGISTVNDQQRARQTSLPSLNAPVQIAELAPVQAVPANVAVPTMSPRKAAVQQIAPVQAPRQKEATKRGPSQFGKVSTKMSLGKNGSRIAGGIVGNMIAGPIGGIVGAMVGNAMHNQAENGRGGGIDVGGLFGGGTTQASVDPSRSTSRSYSTPGGGSITTRTGNDGSWTRTNQYGVTTSRDKDGRFSSAHNRSGMAKSVNGVSRATGTGDGSGEGSKFLCTVARDYGWISDDVLLRDEIAGHAAPQWLYDWYASWGLPWARVCRRNKLFRGMTMPFVAVWANSMALMFNYKVNA